MQLVEEKEVARNACNLSRSDVGGVSAYRQQVRNPNHNQQLSTQQQQQQQHQLYNSSRDDSSTLSNSQKLSLKGTCSKCQVSIQLYTRFRSGKMNKEPFKTCAKCFKLDKKQDSKGENNAVISYIESLAMLDNDNERRRSETL